MKLFPPLKIRKIESPHSHPLLLTKIKSPLSFQEIPSISPFVGQVYRAVSTYHNILTELVMNGNLTEVRSYINRFVGNLSALEVSQSPPLMEEGIII